MRLRILTHAACSAALLVLLAPPARADAWNKKTYVTLPETVEIPGGMLNPGKYVFKLADSLSNRHIVQIFNEREDRIQATVLALPNYRMDPADKTILTFHEMPAGQPEALKAWFYPGDNFGQEFAYPRRRAVEIAQVTHEPVPTSEKGFERVAPAPEPVPAPEAEAREEEPVIVAQAPPPPPPAQIDTPPPAPVEREAAPVEKDESAAPAPSAPREAESVDAEAMPQTSTAVPLLVLLGGLSLGAGTLIRAARRKL
jgi:hypothetical protein